MSAERSDCWNPQSEIYFLKLKMISHDLSLGTNSDSPSMAGCYWSHLVMLTFEVVRLNCGLPDTQRGRERERERVREIGTVYGCYNDELEKYVSYCKRVFEDMKYIGKVNVPIL